MVLPEACLGFGGDRPWSEGAEIAGQGPLQSALSALARQHHCYLVAGTLPLLAADGRAYASTLVWNHRGEPVGRYDKIHLFDAEVKDGSQYRESRHTHPGRQPVVIPTPWGRLGLAVCYDVRFPRLFEALSAAGAELIALPSAFTHRTGQAHWEVLVRARAIESQCYLLAANQWGQHQDGRQTWGQSMVVDPWGQILDQRPEGTGWVSAELSRQYITQVRAEIPALQHRRPLGPANAIKTEDA